jgi:hypothetical protein
LRGERSVVVEPTSIAEPEALVLERVVELVGEHELDQGAIGGDRVGDHEQPLGPGVVGRGREIAGRLIGGPEVLARFEQAGDPPDRVVCRQPELTLLALELARAEPVQVSAADHLRLREAAELQLADALDAVGDPRHRFDADPLELGRIELLRLRRHRLGLGTARAGEREHPAERDQDQQGEQELDPAVVRHRCRV